MTAFADDPDGTDSVTYSLSVNPGNAFAIDANTGVVTVADPSALDFESNPSMQIEVTATSSDTSTSSALFNIAITDDNEFSVGPVSDTDATGNSINELASIGDTVGVTAFADDPDGTDSVTYSLDDDFGGAFAIDTNTGVVTVADPTLLDYETNPNPIITVRATSTDGSFSTANMTINLTDDFEPGDINNLVAWFDASDTTSVNDTDSDGDLDVFEDLTTRNNDAFQSNSAEQPFIETTSGINGLTSIDFDGINDSLRIADTADLNTAPTDGRSINISLQTDSDITSRQVIYEEGGTARGLNIYIDNGNLYVNGWNFPEDNWGPLNVSTGISTNSDYVVSLNFDGVSGTITGFLNGTQFGQVSGANTLYAHGANIGVGGIQQHTYFHDGASTASTGFNFTGEIGEVLIYNQTLNSTDMNQVQTYLVDKWVNDPISNVTDSDSSANTVSESAAVGTYVGITALATDPDVIDTVSYSLDDDFGGAFTIDSITGEVSVADSSLLDYETNPNPTVTVRASSTDGTSSTSVVTVNLSDANEAPTDLTLSANSDTFEYLVENSNPVAFWRLGESAGDTTVVDEMGNHNGTYFQGANTTNSAGPFAGLSNTAANFDGQNDYVEIPNSSAFDLSEGTFHAWFRVDAFDGTDHTIFSMDSSGTDTGSVYLAVDSNRQDLEFYIEDTTAPSTGYGNNSHVLDSADGSITAGVWHHVSITFGPNGMFMYLDGNLVASNSYTGGIGNTDDEPITIGASQRNAATEGQAVSGELDRFFDGQIAEVALFGNALTQPEVNALINSGLNAVELDGTNVVEHALPGTLVGTATAIDPDVGDTFTFSLLDDAAGRFEIDANSGDLRVTSDAQLDFETQSSHSVTIQVTDSGGETYSESFAINLIDVNELLGTNGADNITGTQLADVIHGLAGNDQLSGGQGNDVLYGNDDNDQLFGDDGSDMLFGGAGNDVAFGGDGNDVYVFEALGDTDSFSGGNGGGWTDVVSLDVDISSLPDPSDPWTIAVGGSEVSYDVNQGFLDLGADVAGSITFDDGSEITFDGVERIEW